MQKLEKNYYPLLSLSGSGSKLLLAQLSNSDDVFTIPAYPLMYFPLFFQEWSRENKAISAPKILKLIPKNKLYHITNLFEDAKKNNFKIGVFPIEEDSWMDVGQWSAYRKTLDII